MNHGRFRWFLGWLLTTCAVCGVAAFRQRSELAGLKAELSRVGSADSELVMAVDSSARPAPPASTGTAPGLNARDKIELMKLRSRVTELSEIKRRMARVSEENSALRARTAALSNLAAHTYPPGWVKRADAKSAGFGTPEAAFETFVWALERRDTNALFQALTPEMHTSFLRQWQSVGPEEFWKVAGRIPGFRVSKVTPISDSEVQMEIDMIPGMPSPEVKASRIDGRWRIRM